PVSHSRATDTHALDASCRCLRPVEHPLQRADEQQVHALPTDANALTRLARVLGYRDTPTADARAQLTDELRHHQARVRSIYERLFFRPLLESFAVAGPDGAGAVLSPEAAAAR